MRDYGAEVSEQMAIISAAMRRITDIVTEARKEIDDCKIILKPPTMTLPDLCDKSMKQEVLKAQAEEAQNWPEYQKEGCE